jgi:hypothetical protein
MVSVLASNTVFRGFEPRSGQSKDYEIVFVASPLSTSSTHTRVILWQFFKIPNFVYMKGRFVTNISFATVRLINQIQYFVGSSPGRGKAKTMK